MNETVKKRFYMQKKINLNWNDTSLMVIQIAFVVRGTTCFSVLNILCLFILLTTQFIKHKIVVFKLGNMWWATDVVSKKKKKKSSELKEQH